MQKDISVTLKYLNPILLCMSFLITRVAIYVQK